VISIRGKGQREQKVVMEILSSRGRNYNHVDYYYYDEQQQQQQPQQEQQTEGEGDDGKISFPHHKQEDELYDYTGDMTHLLHWDPSTIPPTRPTKEYFVASHVEETKQRWKQQPRKQQQHCSTIATPTTTTLTTPIVDRSFCLRCHRIYWSLGCSIFLNIILMTVIIYMPKIEHGSSSNRFWDTGRDDDPYMGSSGRRSNRSDVIYGHVHIVPTGGTTINGLLAANYDHVCGSKGYSLDYYEYNERIRISTNDEMQHRTSDDASSSTSSSTNSNNSTVGAEQQQEEDSSAISTMMNRGMFSFEMMEEIGFQDCDYISIKYDGEIWDHIRTVIPKEFKMEIHLPCRDPIDHLMAMCSYRDIEFNCGSDNIEGEIEACVIGMERFTMELQTLAKVDLKCYDSTRMESYLRYMDSRLQSRRIPVRGYVQRDSHGEWGGPRTDMVHGHECLKFYTHLVDDVVKILLKKYDYYQ